MTSTCARCSAAASGRGLIPPPFRCGSSATWRRRRAGAPKLHRSVWLPCPAPLWRAANDGTDVCPGRGSRDVLDRQGHRFPLGHASHRWQGGAVAIRAARSGATPCGKLTSATRRRENARNRRKFKRGTVTGSPVKVNQSRGWQAIHPSGRGGQDVVREQPPGWKARARPSHRRVGDVRRGAWRDWTLRRRDPHGPLRAVPRDNGPGPGSGVGRPTWGTAGPKGSSRRVSTSGRGLGVPAVSRVSSRSGSFRQHRVPR